MKQPPVIGIFKIDDDTPLLSADQTKDTAMMALIIIMGTIFGSLFGVLVFLATLFITPLGLP